MGHLVLEVIPYLSFKEKIKLTKKYEGNKVECFDKYIIVGS